MSDPAAAPTPPVPDALGGALRALLAPLVRLALARGLTQPTLEELLKQALVQQADAALQALPPHRRVSRITTTTGIHRREVSRLLQDLRSGHTGTAAAPRSHAGELFVHWRSDAAYADPASGAPRVLPRQGPAPSFEALAQQITRDVHPRSLLDELVRLGLAAEDTAQDTVALLRDSFVPQGDDAQLLGVLGRNVGAHLNAAVDNVVRGPHSHIEQAVYADGLSDQALAEFRTLANAQWQALQSTLVQALEALLARDAAPDAAPTAARHAVRLGLYTHQRALPAEPAEAAPPPTGTPP